MVDRDRVPRTGSGDRVRALPAGLGAAGLGRGRLVALPCLVHVDRSQTGRATSFDRVPLTASAGSVQGGVHWR